MRFSLPIGSVRKNILFKEKFKILLILYYYRAIMNRIQKEEE